MMGVCSQPHIIKLNQLQYAFYKKSRLENHSPTDTMLTLISKPLPTTTDEDAVYQLYCQTLLLEVVFYDVSERVKLPPWAFNSVVRVMGRIDEHLKKQALL
ncbi:MAG: hypothetical protein B0W54_20785 [Cellvibrio sp. 79]|nr:MAG: hypothetical protein B0W54_20785 [Cellvibrio sp. 79]